VLLLDSPDTRPRENASTSLIVTPSSVIDLLVLKNDVEKTTPERGGVSATKP